MRTIIVTERYDTVRDIIESALGEAGYQVITADSGEYGLALFRRFDPDLITTCMRLNHNEAGNMLDRMDGFEYAMHLREEGCKVPILAITGGGPEGVVEYASRYGVSTSEIGKYINSILGKPFGFDELVEEVSKLLPQ